MSEDVTNENDPAYGNRDGSSNQSYKLSVTTETYSEPALRYSLFPLELVQDDHHRMQEDLNHVPRPEVHPQSSSTFILSADTVIL